jgi:N-acetylglucosamine-6-sulfatase
MQIRRGDNQYRHRLQALQSVDDMLNNTVALLTVLGIIDNTFIIYTSDNGFHIGQHRLPAGKRCPYEEDVNVPLIIRGPGIPKGQTANFVTSHTDITPSIVHWAGALSGIELDGSPIPIDSVTVATRETFEHAQMEFWGNPRDDMPFHKQPNINGYKALRVIGKDYNLFYSVWCDGAHEVYDMMVSST